MVWCALGMRCRLFDSLFDFVFRVILGELRICRVQTGWLSLPDMPLGPSERMSIFDHCTSMSKLRSRMNFPSLYF